MKRRHEIICQQGLHQLLEAVNPSLAPQWEEVEDDPPDWYLTWAGTRYAVEATSITDRLSLGQSTMPSPAVTASLAAFVDEIEQEASGQGILRGAYLVALAPIPNLREHKQELKARFLKYILDTRDLPSAPEYELGFVRNERVSIAKLHSDAQYVAEVISFEVKSGHEAQTDLGRYLAEALAAKKIKLTRVKEPIVLVILDAFNYSHIADWRKAISGVQDRHSFRAIVRVSPPEQPQLVWAAPGWLTNSESSAG